MLRSTVMCRMGRRVPAVDPMIRRGVCLPTSRTGTVGNEEGFGASDADVVSIASGKRGRSASRAAPCNAPAQVAQNGATRADAPFGTSVPEVSRAVCA